MELTLRYTDTWTRKQSTNFHLKFGSLHLTPCYLLASVLVQTDIIHVLLLAYGMGQKYHLLFFGRPMTVGGMK